MYRAGSQGLTDKGAKRWLRRHMFKEECKNFNKFPAFARRFKQLDPMGHVDLRVEEGRFHSFFFAAGALRAAQLQLRTMIGLDGTFSKCKWQYVMLTATALDANDGIVLLAVAIVLTGYTCMVPT